MHQQFMYGMPSVSIVMKLNKHQCNHRDLPSQREWVPLTIVWDNHKKHCGRNKENVAASTPRQWFHQPCRTRQLLKVAPFRHLQRHRHECWRLQTRHRRRHPSRTAIQAALGVSGGRGWSGTCVASVWPSGSLLWRLLSWVRRTNHQSRGPSNPPRQSAILPRGRLNPSHRATKRQFGYSPGHLDPASSYSVAGARLSAFLLFRKLQHWRRAGVLRQNISSH